MTDGMLAKKEEELRSGFAALERQQEDGECAASGEFETLTRRYEVLSKEIANVKDSEMQVDRYDLMLRAERLMQDLRALRESRG